MTALETTIDETNPAAPPTRAAGLTGGTTVWLYMAVELVTFGLFLLAHAWGWHTDPEAHAAAQSKLHPVSGVIGTAILLVGSGLAYRAVLAKEAGQPRAASRWLIASALSGVAFSVNKVGEYASPELADVTLSTSAFWFSYLFLTGLHLLHVIAGVGLFAWLAWRVRAPGPTANEDAEGLTVELGAAYWHLVDVIWVLLFPILYLMKP